MGHKFEESELFASREESAAASAAKGFVCKHCGSLQDAAEHDSAPKRFAKRVKKAVKEA